MVYKVNMYKKNQKRRRTSRTKKKRQITLENLKQRLEKACFIAQGGSIEDLPNDTSANQDSGSAVSTSNQNQQPSELLTSNVPGNASNVPAAAQFKCCYVTIPTSTN